MVNWLLTSKNWRWHRKNKRLLESHTIWPTTLRWLESCTVFPDFHKNFKPHVNEERNWKLLMNKKVLSILNCLREEKYKTWHTSNYFYNTNELCSSLCMKFEIFVFDSTHSSLTVAVWFGDFFSVIDSIATDKWTLIPNPIAMSVNKCMPMTFLIPIILTKKNGKYFS